MEVRQEQTYWQKAREIFGQSPLYQSMASKLGGSTTARKVQEFSADVRVRASPATTVAPTPSSWGLASRCTALSWVRVGAHRDVGQRRGEPHGGHAREHADGERAGCDVSRDPLPRPALRHAHLPAVRAQRHPRRHQGARSGHASTRCAHERCVIRTLALRPTPLTPTPLRRTWRATRRCCASTAATAWWSG